MVTRYVKMDDDAVRIYRDMERKLFIELDSGKEVEALNAGSKTMKLLQIASGAIYTDDKGSWEEVHTAKLDEMDFAVSVRLRRPRDRVWVFAYTFWVEPTRAKRVVARTQSTTVIDEPDLTPKISQAIWRGRPRHGDKPLKVGRHGAKGASTLRALT